MEGSGDCINELYTAERIAQKWTQKHIFKQFNPASLVQGRCMQVNEQVTLDLRCCDGFDQRMARRRRDKHLLA
jgi:hypothetical protein